MPEIIVKLGGNVVHRYFLYRDEVTIGRSPDNEIAIENLAVSRNHARIRQRDGRYILEDNNSANGTYVNGVRVTKTEILDKDVITVGKHKLHFYDQQFSQPAASNDIGQKTMLVDAAVQTAPVLRVVNGKQRDQVFPVEKVETRIGRTADNDIRLNDWFVSKHHALIIRKGSSYLVRDLNSWRHTLVNGSIIQEQNLNAGDRIQFGPKTTVLFEMPDTEGAPEGPGRMPVELEQSLAGGSASHDEHEFEIPADGNGSGGAAAGQSEQEERQASRATDVLDEEPVEEVVQVQSAVIEQAEWSDNDSAEESLSEIVEESERLAGPVIVDEDSGEWAVQPSTSEASVDAEVSELLLREPDTVGRSDAEPDAFEESWEEAPAEEASPEESSVTTAEAEERAEAAPSEDGEDSPEVALWLKALENPSSVIRKQAQRKLKQLTGRDYDVD